MDHESKTPILDIFLSQGVIWVDGDEYVGKSSDGVIVRLGNTDQPQIAEAYLRDYKPENW